jgi:glutaryl-CoA dehydrogenase
MRPRSTIATEEETVHPDPCDYVGLDDLLTDEEVLLRDTVRRFVDDQWLPVVAEHFEAGTFPTDLIPRIGELGVFGMHLDGYGCAGSSARAYGIACRELERGDSGLRSLVSVQGSLSMFAIWRYGSEEQKQEWLPRMATGEVIGCFGLTEPDHGSDPSDMATKARRDGDDWVLSGAKRWITNAGLAQVAVVWARTDDGVAGFIVPTDTPGVDVRPIKQKLSLRASVTGEIYLDDCRVPEANRLPGARSIGAPLSCLTEARFGVAFGAVGAASACLQSAISYTTDRPQFGKPIAAHQITQLKLANMVTGLTNASLLAFRLADLKDAGKVLPSQISLGKRHNVRVAIDIAREARTMLGANGVSLEYPPIRHAANLESVLTYEGTEEIHALVIGEAVTGLSAFR